MPHPIAPALVPTFLPLFMEFLLDPNLWIAFAMLTALEIVLGIDNIVFIAAGAEHRAPALEACRWLIDELKERVPIWKKEVTPQGDSWVVPHP